MQKPKRNFLITLLVLVISLVIGQAISFALGPAAWKSYIKQIPHILSMIAFWSPIVALIAALFVWFVMRMLGFDSLEEIREESVEQNNPAPAIIFVGTLIACILFLTLVIKP
jgi:heme/copper-type cytochrome/quinol oxidase subunit 2